MTSRRRLGFSLLEVIVAALVAGLILLMGVRMLREVQIVFVDVQRLAPEPLAQHAVALIRADVQSARRVWPGSAVWPIDPLRLEMPDGRVVQYDSDLGQLVRTVTGGEEGQAGARTVLRRVNSWRWHQLPGGAVEVMLIYSRPRDPGSRLSGSKAGPRNRETMTESLVLRYTMRAVAGRVGW